jgi:hypothetical protein
MLRLVELNLIASNQTKLPFLDSNCILKNDHEIAHRILVLFSLKQITVYPEDYTSICNFLLAWGYDKFMSNYEKQIFNQKKLSTTQKVNFSWYSESLYTLLWVSGIVKVKAIEWPFDEIKIPQEVLNLIPVETEFEEFIDVMKIRKIDEILTELDFYYYLNWLSNEEYLMKKSMLKRIFKDKEKLNFSVIRQRREALEWVMYSNLRWGEFSLDT